MEEYAVGPLHFCQVRRIQTFLIAISLAMNNELFLSCSMNVAGVMFSCFVDAVS